jgi:F-type H+-transporting ATPase subunit b
MEGLGISLSTLLAQIVNFLILLALLYIFAYKPFMNMLDQRSNKIKESLAEADKVREASRSKQQRGAGSNCPCYTVR